MTIPIRGMKAMQPKMAITIWHLTDLCSLFRPSRPPPTWIDADEVTIVREEEESNVDVLDREISSSDDVTGFSSMMSPGGRWRW